MRNKHKKIKAEIRRVSAFTKKVSTVSGGKRITEVRRRGIKEAQRKRKKM